MPHLDDEDEDEDDAAHTRKSPANARTRSAATPKTPLYRRATISSYSSGGSSSSATSSIRSDSMFPNIQASTSATPGKTERSKLGTHSIMTMKLHVAGSASTLSHSKREIEAINNSLYVWLLADRIESREPLELLCRDQSTATDGLVTLVHPLTPGGRRAGSASSKTSAAVSSNPPCRCSASCCRRRSRLSRLTTSSSFVTTRGRVHSHRYWTRRHQH